MYGVDSAVHPDYRGRGVGSILMDARFSLLKRLNLRGMVAGSLFIDYHHVADQMSVEEYVQQVIDGKRFDTNLTKQLHKGFRVHNLIPDYIDEPRTHSYAAAIVWHNPDFDPARPILRHVPHEPIRLHMHMRPHRAPSGHRPVVMP